MAALHYHCFLKLCEEWPVDKTKRGRDLGTYLQKRVAQAFWEGENTQMYQSLAQLHLNYYKHKYHCPRDTSFSGLSMKEYKLILSIGTLEEFQEMDKSVWQKLQEKFTPMRPEEKHKAWAWVLS
ncbi:ubiquinol-cytochrome-c reductase complex assembly factor 2-like isoform X2 [Onychomys torridus]|uniref:ubiquinol-cytochrome-c reductase complex assembly factor 2-like isoform X2 n=1 Tax=Onychomys torridus TaxID=38674 RepID=UPI00167F3C8A|nr:ubiquinol-cytochrome-c reductase complex assembly factor 2-like isoform X2 [Onychomys torridus]